MRTNCAGGTIGAAANDSGEKGFPGEWLFAARWFCSVATNDTQYCIAEVDQIRGMYAAVVSERYGDLVEQHAAVPRRWY